MLTQKQLCQLLPDLVLHTKKLSEAILTFVLNIARNCKLASPVEHLLILVWQARVHKLATHKWYFQVPALKCTPIEFNHLTSMQKCGLVSLVMINVLLGKDD